jgi:predicted outer membrane protein
MTSLPRFTTAVALVLALAAAGGAYAADSQTKPGRGHGGMGQMMCGSDSDARMASHHAYMETKLKLTDAQKAEFKKLGETMKAAHEPMKAFCTDMQNQTNLTLPKRMELRQKMLEAKLDALKTELPAMTSFYNSLTPDQQKQADAMMDHGQGMKGQGMGQGMGMGGGMGGHHRHQQQ